MTESGIGCDSCPLVCVIFTGRHRPDARRSDATGQVTILGAFAGESARGSCHPRHGFVGAQLPRARLFNCSVERLADAVFVDEPGSNHTASSLPVFRSTAHVSRANELRCQRAAVQVFLQRHSLPITDITSTKRLHMLWRNKFQKTIISGVAAACLRSAAYVQSRYTDSY